MRTSMAIKNWGNSAAIRLPVALLHELKVEVGDELSAEIEGDRLVLRKFVPFPTYRIESLLAEMPDNISTLPEWEALMSVGKESI